MHLGRSHHLGREIAVSVVGGFAASFMAFVVNTYTQNYGKGIQGQLLAGDPSANREFPTTLNTMHAAMDGQSSVLNAMGSYGFWIAVMIGGVIASFIIFRLARRYV
ncbi:MAG: hypothetical protein KBA40_00350 [Candidatus Peribacteraceae bacterium]|nr:hypothetical protein [Candidatus Peribacteraceae bacterium]MBP9850274.1 hypothetical protein [Candidatus Peribacteraceae bacterium]